MRLPAACFAAICALVAACTHDFDVFEAGADAGQPAADSSVPEDAGARDVSVETGPCTPSSSCLDTARSCAKACDTTQGECFSRCKEFSCFSECRSARDTCRKKCSSDCTDCTTDAVCAAQKACESATN
jgi:hypothetical protein